MIFSNKLNKIISGTNISVFPKSSTKTILYTNNNNLTKSELEFGTYLRCITSFLELNLDYIAQIDESKFLIGMKSNVTVTDELQQN